MKLGGYPIVIVEKLPCKMLTPPARKKESVPKTGPAVVLKGSAPQKVEKSLLVR
jgi:hypothetical protein